MNLRKIIDKIPYATKLLIKFNESLSTATFSGWGMNTYTLTPWCNGGGNDLAWDFLKTNEELLSKVNEGKFNLLQFKDIPDKKRELDSLMWRHYIVFWSARYAAKIANNYPVKNLIECGVCDGLTIYFAMSSLNGKYNFKSFLYDAWDVVDTYSFLDIENTKNNLSSFKNETVFNKGYIPESFRTLNNPSEIAWLHIDLNSSVPTKAALQFFFARLQPGGVILFDDYGRHAEYETRLIINDFFSKKDGILLPLPTGQAIYFKVN
jgi:hypothetical protein